MKHTLALIALAALIAGCQTPGSTGGYVIYNEPESRATISIGGNGSQTVGMHSPTVPGSTANGETAADATANTAKASGIFSNANTGNRSAELDATAAIETMKHVKGTNAGLTQGRDQSPSTATQTPTNTTHDERPVSVPISVGK